MIYQNNETENTQNQFSNAIRELQLGKLLRKANDWKASQPLFIQTLFGDLCWES
jgi:hypothetical protein